MNTQLPQLWQVFWDIVKLGLLIVTGWITWAFRKSVSRIDKLERESVQRTEFNNTIESLRTDNTKNIESLRCDLKHSATETHRRLDKLYLHISDRKRDPD